MMTRSWTHLASFAAAAALLVAVAGCFNPFNPIIAANRVDATPPPNPNSPRNLMLLFEWAYERQDLTVYEELFTADYRFTFAAEDSAGNPPLTRDDEIQVARNLFLVGSATEPPANKIDLTYLSDLVARPDRRPGKTDPWHKEISVRVDLRVETDDIIHTVIGKALFFVVRGDSAQIPEELRQRGFGPDINRWYIEGWEDQTGNLTSQIEALAGTATVGAAPPRGTRGVARPEAAGPGATTNPGQGITWSALKRIYLTPS